MTTQEQIKRASQNLSEAESRRVVKIHEINEVERLRGALKKVSDLIETNQGCSPNNHTIAVLVMDALRPK